MRGSGQSLPGGYCVTDRLLPFAGEGQVAAEHAESCMLQILKRRLMDRQSAGGNAEE